MTSETFPDQLVTPMGDPKMVDYFSFRPEAEAKQLPFHGIPKYATTLVSVDFDEQPKDDPLTKKHHFDPKSVKGQVFLRNDGMSKNKEWGMKIKLPDLLNFKINLISKILNP